MFIAKGTPVQILPERDARGQIIPQVDGITGRKATVATDVLLGASLEEVEIEVQILNDVRLKVPDYRVRILRSAEVSNV